MEIRDTFDHYSKYNSTEYNSPAKSVQRMRLSWTIVKPDELIDWSIAKAFST